MKRNAMPLLERIHGSAQFVMLGATLLISACGDNTSSAVDAHAGQATGGGDTANGGGSDSGRGGSATAGSSDGDDAGDDGSGTAGARATAGAAGSALHTGGASALGGSGALGSSGAGNASGTPLLGAPCASDTDCGSGLICLRSNGTELDGAGPANGLCTAVCTGSADCAKLEAGAQCFDYGASGYCLESCTPGDPLEITAKCQGRGDFACAELDPGQAFCLPLCRADVECGAARFCNPATGLCEKTKPVGDPVGTACDPAATTATCLGTCLRTSADGVTPVTGVCTELCSGALGCMYDDAGTQPGGLCVGPFTDTFGLLDLGFCFPSCTCSGECPSFGSKCRAWTSAEVDYQDYLGKPGLC